MTCLILTIVCHALQEDEYGRARVHAQWGDEEEAIREAVDLCPVDCISFVTRAQLALLEYVMKGCAREDIAIMARRCTSLRLALALS